MATECIDLTNTSIWVFQLVTRDVERPPETIDTQFLPLKAEFSGAVFRFVPAIVTELSQYDDYLEDIDLQNLEDIKKALHRNGNESMRYHITRIYPQTNK